MRAAIVRPIIGVAFAPLIVGVPLVQFVVGIMGKLFLLPEPLAGSLACLLAAIALVSHAWIGNEQATTVGATNLTSHLASPSEAMKPCFAREEKPGSEGIKRIEEKEIC